MEKYKLKSSIKYPTTILVRGNNFLGFEIAKSLIEQGGYVIVIDYDIDSTKRRYKAIENSKLLTILDFESVEYLEDDLRRLDYVFFLNHEFDNANVRVSSKEFLQASNYLDLMIRLALKFEAKFLLTSSIKAHQILLSDGRLEADFGVNVHDKHMIYTQIEIQRYSETLVLEAIEKSNLDARIVRLGKVIGPGMDFDPEDSFDKLILDAIYSKHFKLRSDGLETNMYIHVLDAAYGLIKAMFTNGTQGKIFSLANEEEVTDLSIAYKLQELTGLNHDIKFIDENDNYPPVRFYKPAQSLSIIGWKPRISFVRALAQVLQYARDRFKNEQENHNFQKELEEPDLQNFDEEDEPKGALARLIAERKAQEKMRKGKILLANEKIHEKHKNQRQLSFQEKLERVFFKFYDSLAKKFEFLKTVTIKEAFGYLLLLVIFLIVYIGVISPILLIGRRILEIQYYESKISNQDINNYEVITDGISHIDNNLQDIELNLERLERVYKIFNKEGFIKERSDLNNIHLYATNLSKGYDILTEFDAYWRNQEGMNLVYTPASESLLTSASQDVSSTEENLKALLQAKSQNSINILDQLEMHRDYFSETNLSSIFSILDLNRLINDLNQETDQLTRNIKMSDVYTELILTKDIRTYAIILQDNSRITPAGGYPASLGFIQLKDGHIINVSLKPFDQEMDLDLNSLTENQISEIQMASGGSLASEDLTFSKLFLIEDKNEVFDAYKEYFFDEFKIEPDAIFFINLQTLSEMIDNTESLEFNQVIISKSSLLSSINLLQSDKEDMDTRNTIIANIFALEISKLFENRDYLYSLTEVFEEATQNNQIDILSDELFLQASDNNLDLNQKDWLKVSVTVDYDNYTTDYFPSLNMKISDVISEDLNLQRNITISKGNLKSVERVIVCMPSNSHDFDLKNNSVSLGQTFGFEEICVTGDFTFTEKLEFSYLLDDIASQDKSRYNIEFNLRSADGLSLIYDYDVNVSPGLAIVEAGNTILSQDKKLISSGSLSGIKQIYFKLSK